MAATDRRETDAGIEIKPVYDADDAPGELEPPGEFPFTRGPYPDMYRGRPWTIRQYAGFASAEETNQRFRYLLERGQTGLSVAFDLPTQLGYDSDDPRAVGEVGRTGVAIDSLADMELLFDQIPLDRVSTSMTINAPAALLLLLYELVAEGQGVSRRAAPRHRPERHPQGVHRPRELHLPAAALDAADDRPVRLLRRAAAALEHDLDLRLPHPRGRLDGGAGARVHARERDRLLQGRGRRGALAGRVRRAALVLLQRAQPLLPGGGEVPRGPAALGGDHARPLRRDQPEGAGAPLPRPDGRLDPHRAAAREQHRPRRDPGALGGLRAARSRSTRTRSTRRSRCRPSTRPGSRSARSSCSRTRPAAPTRPTRSAAPTSSRR